MGLTFSETLMSLQPDALNLPCLIKLLANHYLTEGENVLSQMSLPCINFSANTPLYTKPYVWHKCADCQPCFTPSLGQSTQYFIRPQLRHNTMKIHPLWATSLKNGQRESDLSETTEKSRQRQRNASKSCFQHCMPFSAIPRCSHCPHSQSAQAHSARRSLLRDQQQAKSHGKSCVVSYFLSGDSSRLSQTLTFGKHSQCQIFPHLPDTCAKHILSTDKCVQEGGDPMLPILDEDWDFSSPTHTKMFSLQWMI